MQIQGTLEKSHFLSGLGTPINYFRSHVFVFDILFMKNLGWVDRKNTGLISYLGQMLVLVEATLGMNPSSYFDVTL